MNSILQFLSKVFFFISFSATFCKEFRLLDMFMIEQVSTMTETHRKELTDIELALLEQRATLLARLSFFLAIIYKTFSDYMS